MIVERKINMYKGLREDIKMVLERDPAVKSWMEVFLCYPGIHAVQNHRFAHWLYKGGHFLAARLLSQYSRFFTGIEIHPGAVIGRRLFIDHGMGVVIGETAEIGDDVTLYQGVTLGGTGKHTGKRHPTLGNNVTVGSGAKVLGPITVGDHAKIGAGAVVVRCVPHRSTAVGVPAQVVGKDGDEKIEIDLDQMDLPNILENEIVELARRITALEKELGNRQD